MKRIWQVMSILLIASVAFTQSSDELKRERGGANSAAKDALEGKAPPKFKMEEWQNIEKAPKEWKDLKGKVVLLDFWAYW